MIAGGIMIAVVGQFFNGTSGPMVAAIALCACGALVASVLTLRGVHPAAQMAE
jgi:hypothetical protein